MQNQDNTHTHTHTHLKTILHKQYVGRESLYLLLLNSIATQHQCNVWWQCQVMPQILQAHTLAALWIHSIHLISLLQPNQQAAQLWANVDISVTVQQCTSHTDVETSASITTTTTITPNTTSSTIIIPQPPAPTLLPPHHNHHDHCYSTMLESITNNRQATNSGEVPSVASCPCKSAQCFKTIWKWSTHRYTNIITVSLSLCTKKADIPSQWMLKKCALVYLQGI